MELARTLGENPDAGHVDLLTRRVVDHSVSADYAQPFERFTDNVQIVRIDCGEESYLAKELLWDCLDNFADSTLDYFKRQARNPAIIHNHYADAGYVGTRISHQLGIPLVYTGHSLGRSKRPAFNWLKVRSWRAICPECLPGR